MMPCETGALDT